MKDYITGAAIRPKVRYVFRWPSVDRVSPPDSLRGTNSVYDRSCSINFLSKIAAALNLYEAVRAGEILLVKRSNLVGGGPC